MKSRLRVLLLFGIALAALFLVFHNPAFAMAGGGQHYGGGGGGGGGWGGGGGGGGGVKQRPKNREKRPYRACRKPPHCFLQAR